MRSLDLLELELRRLPNVSYVGFVSRPDTMVVQVLAIGSPDAAMLRTSAERLCRMHLDQSFHVEIAGSTRPTRVRILDVRTGAIDLDAIAADRRSDEGPTSAHDEELEVHLGFEGVRTIGRGKAGDPHGAAQATFEALKRMGAAVPFHVEAAALFEHSLGEGVMLVLGSSSVGERYGVAAADTIELAAVRATLHALNRFLSTQKLPALAV